MQLADLAISCSDFRHSTEVLQGDLGMWYAMMDPTIRKHQSEAVAASFWSSSSFLTTSWDEDGNATVWYPVIPYNWPYKGLGSTLPSSLRCHQVTPAVNLKRGCNGSWLVTTKSCSMGKVATKWNSGLLCDEGSDDSRLAIHIIQEKAQLQEQWLDLCGP